MTREQLANNCIWWNRLVCLHRPGAPVGLIEKTQPGSVFIGLLNAEGPDLESLRQVLPGNSFIVTSKGKLIPDQCYFGASANSSPRHFSSTSRNTRSHLKVMKVKPTQLNTPDFYNTRQLCPQLNKTVKEGDMFDIH